MLICIQVLHAHAYILRPHTTLARESFLIAFVLPKKHYEQPKGELLRVDLDDRKFE